MEFSEIINQLSYAIAHARPELVFTFYSAIILLFIFGIFCLIHFLVKNDIKEDEKMLYYVSYTNPKKMIVFKIR